ncbi:hypothetical protein EJB05_25705, partial [Eragrostis curvula]
MALSPRRCAPMTTLVVLGAVLVFVTTTFVASPASADLVNQTGQLTVFWGQHKDEGSLREACDTGVYTMVIMSFLDVYGSGQYNLDISGHPVAGMGDEIKHCQSKGVLVSLAIGGTSRAAIVDDELSVVVPILDTKRCQAENTFVPIAKVLVFLNVDLVTREDLNEAEPALAGHGHELGFDVPLRILLEEQLLLTN